MQLNPTLVTILGLIVFGLGYLVKKRYVDLNGKPMFWLIVGISLVGGVVHVVAEAQIAPLPPMPADPLQIIFAWVPSVVGWVAASTAAVLAASQLVYSLIKKGLWPDAPLAE